MSVTESLVEVVGEFGTAAKAKLSNPAASGAPEDQLRAPLEGLIADLAGLRGFRPGRWSAVGESLARPILRPVPTMPSRCAGASSASSRSRRRARAPTRAVSGPARQGAVGEAPSRCRTCSTPTATRSALARRRARRADRPARGRRRDGGRELAAPAGLLRAVRRLPSLGAASRRSSAQQLAEVSARLCRLLRDEVTEQLASEARPSRRSPTDWRKLLFPEATDAAVRRRLRPGRHLRPARWRGRETSGWPTASTRSARQLGKTNSLIGAALRLLTDDVDNQATLKTRSAR